MFALAAFLLLFRAQVSTALVDVYNATPPSNLAPPTSGPEFWITGPEHYRSLTGDMEVFYQVPTGTGPFRARVQDSSGVVLATTNVPSKTHPSGRVIIPCGMVHMAGNYSFHLWDPIEGVIVANGSRETVVSWPNVVAHVATLLETFGSDVDIKFEFPDITCTPFQKDEYGFNVNLVYLGPMSIEDAEEHQSLSHYWMEPSIVYQHRLSNWSHLMAQDVTVDCVAFDRAGFYKIEVRVVHRKYESLLEPVSTSVPIQVAWSHRYLLNVAQNTIGSCLDGINVIYRYPACVLDKDRLRVYGLRENESSSAYDYLFERRLPKGKHALNLACHLFPQGYREFCFSYISVASNDAVTEIHKQCRPSSVTQALVSRSQWGDWSEWSYCTGICNQGTQIRYRLCLGARESCVGDEYDVRPCTLRNCPEVTFPPLEPGTEMAEHCACGCTTDVFRNQTVHFQLQKCSGDVTWILRPVYNLNGIIMVKLSNIKLVLDQQHITVRNGVLRISPLIALITGNPEEKIPEILRSSSGPIRVDFLHTNVSSPHTLHSTTRNTQQYVGFTMSFWEHKEILEQKSGGAPINYITSWFFGDHVTLFYALASALITLLLIVVICLIVVHRVYLCRWNQKAARRRSVFSVSDVQLESDEHRQHLLSQDSLATITSEITVPSSSSLSHHSGSTVLANDHSVHPVMLPPYPIPSPPPTPVVPPRCNESPSHAGNGWNKPVATVSPQMHRPKRSSAKRRSILKNSQIASMESLQDSDRESVPPKRVRVTDVVLSRLRAEERNTVGPLSSSLSEFSTSGTEDGFELDDYDYGCHDIPGSFFVQPPPQVVCDIGWPPFMPQPPPSEDFPLHMFKLPPSTVHIDLSSSEAGTIAGDACQ